MAFEFRLPDIGEGVVEGEVVRWLVKAGDAVREDQPMVEVMTDKATVEIPSPKAGRIASIEVPDGKIAKVGQVLVRIEVGAGAQPPGASPATATAVATPSAKAAAHGASHAPPAPEVKLAPATVSQTAPTFVEDEAVGTSGKVLATPATRKLARDLGVDLRRVSGTGDGGRITTQDVRGFADRGPSVMPVAARAATLTRETPVIQMPAMPSMKAEPDPSYFKAQPGPATVDFSSSGVEERIPFRGVRKKIADNMSRSKHTAAHFTYVEEVDLTDLVAVRARAKAKAEERGIKLSYLPFIVKAVVAGLKKFPIVNSTLDEERGEIVLRKRYNIGVAAASDQGLIVPVVKDADQKSIFQLAKEIEDVSARAKVGRASRDELTGSTFTISSLGQLGGVLATPIINFPEVAVLGVHKIKQAPVVRNGQIVIRDVANFSISLDHRIVDGYEGALFLQHVLSLLGDPTMLFMELV